MIPIYIDTATLSEDYSLSQQQIESMMDYVVKEVTANFARNWEEEAKKTLKSSRQQYVNAINVVDEGKMKGSVVLVGQLPNMIEQGVGAFDMKDGFAKSSKKKMKKDGGWYMTIPFRIGTPGSLAENSIFSAKMPEEVYNIIKVQPTNVSMKDGSMRSKGMKASEIPQPYDQPKTRPAVSNIQESKTFQEYKNRASIFTGMIKVKDKDTGQNRYISFRRVSDKSPADSWIHTGVTAYNLSEKALTNTDIPTIVDKAIDNYLSNLGFS